jgi:hypothetical protein
MNDLSNAAGHTARVHKALTDEAKRYISPEAVATVLAALARSNEIAVEPMTYAHSQAALDSALVLADAANLLLKRLLEYRHHVITPGMSNAVYADLRAIQDAWPVLHSALAGSPSEDVEKHND